MPGPIISDINVYEHRWVTQDGVSLLGHDVAAVLFRGSVV